MIAYFAGHRTAANLLMAFFFIAGLLVAPELRRETFPDIPPRLIEVSVPYPGASAGEVENAICQRIEDAVEGVTDLFEIACEAREGLARATAKMAEGADFDRFLADVKTEIEAIDKFPSEVEKPVIRQLGRTDLVALVAITGPMPPGDLKAYAEDVKDRLLLTGEILQIVIRGFSDHQFRIEIAAETLRRYGLSIADIADSVARQSVDLPAGTIETTDRELLIRFADERRSPHEFADLVVIAGKTGAQIRLGDIASIEDRFEREEDKVLFNGKRAALLEIVKTRDQDTLDVIAAVRSFLAEERATAPAEIVLEITADVSSIVRDRLELLIKNGIAGLFLVFLVLWLFFGLRFSFWVAMGLPVSFLGTIAVMWAIGYSIDMMTMVGLLIAIGLLMDDAIVIAENVAVHRARGKAARAAAIDGVREVMPGVFSSFATTAFVFGSLAFLKGDIGAVLRVVPVMLLITLTVSLFEAFLILPHHLAGAMESAGEPSRFRIGFEARLDWFRQRILGRAVDFCIAWRYLIAGTAIGLLLLSAGLFAGGWVKFQAFPEIEGDVVEARILLPQGTPLARTEAVVDQIQYALRRSADAFAADQPDGRDLLRNITIQFNKNVDAFETGPHVATVTADLLGAEIRGTRIDDLLNRWRRETGAIADILTLEFTEFQIGIAGRAIDIRLAGDDLGQLKAAATELRSWLGGYRGAFDIGDDLRPGKPEIRLRLRDGAGSLGVDARMIATQLRAAYFGKTASEIQVGREAYDVDLRLAGRDRDSLADLEYFTVVTPTGAEVPLGAIAVIEQGRGFARINRINGRRTVTIRGDIDTRIANASQIVADTKSRFLPELRRRHPNVAASFEGQEREAGTTASSIRTGFIVGLVGVFLLLSFQFQSYTQPILIMLAIPMALIGAIWGHLVMGLNLSMPSMIGAVSLAGIAVNDSILLVRFIQSGRRRGLTASQAAGEASRARFRAVLLTSLTTIAGVLPLLAEKSLQAQVLIPLITSLAFGLVASTAMVLFLVPSLFAILDDFGLVPAPNQPESLEVSA